MLALVASSLTSGLAEGLNYVAQIEGGYMLYTILHSSVVFFACVIAVLVLGTRVTPQQLGGAAMVVVELLATAVPQPLVARRSFAIGLAASAGGSLFLAVSYPLAELVFRLARRPPPEEAAAFYGSLVNVAIFTSRTLLFTLPRWQEMVIAPIYDDDVADPLMLGP